MNYLKKNLHGPNFLPPCTLPYALKKNFKSLLIFIYQKSKILTVIVSKMRVLGEKNRREGGVDMKIDFSKNNF